ncbi:MAG: HdeD family acid-resistance protein [Frankia sp.]
MLRSLSSGLLWRGAVAVVLGLVTISWPGVTIGVVLVLFSIYVLLDAMAQFGLAYVSRRQGSPVAGRVAAGLLDVAAAVITLAWPHITALALVVLVGLWAVIGGLVEIGVAFTVPLATAERVLLATAGALSILLGIVLFAHPGSGAYALAIVFGLFTLFFGVSALVGGYRLRSFADASPGDPTRRV